MHEVPQAVKYHEGALRIAHDLGDRRQEGRVLGNLGNALQELGQHGRAAECYQQFLFIAREVGDRQGEATALVGLGASYASTRARHATSLWQEAALIFHEINDLLGEARALWNTSVALHELGDRPESIANATAALSIFQEIGDRDCGTISERLAEWNRERQTDV